MAKPNWMPEALRAARSLGAGFGLPHFLFLCTILVVLGFGMLMLHGNGADDAIYVAMRNSRSQIELVAKGLSKLGRWELLRGLAMAAALLLLLQRKVCSAAVLILLTSLGKVLEGQAKLSIGLPRPNSALWLTHVSSPTFPSGHATQSMLVYLSIALLLTDLGGTRRWPIAAALSVSILVGMSRVMLGVHWPSDVVAGWSFGAAWAVLWCFAALKLETMTSSLRTAAPLNQAR